MPNKKSLQPPCASKRVSAFCMDVAFNDGKGTTTRAVQLHDAPGVRVVPSGRIHHTVNLVVDARGNDKERIAKAIHSAYSEGMKKGIEVHGSADRVDVGVKVKDQSARLTKTGLRDDEATMTQLAAIALLHGDSAERF